MFSAIVRAVRRLALAGVLAVAGLTAAKADDGLPAPVAGVTFDEWAAGNARIVNNQPLDGVLKTLQIDEAKWKAARARFEAALSAGPADSAAIRRYGEVFANPAVGRFKGASDQPEIKAKLATFEDYARVQAHLSVGVEAHVDPQAVLKEHGLTVYEWSQEAGNWVKEYAELGGKEGAMEEIARKNAIVDRFAVEYRRRYGVKKPAEPE